MSNAMIQGKQPMVLQRMGDNWAELAQMITAFLAMALYWMDDNVVTYITELTVQKEYVSKRAQIYWSYLRPVRIPPPFYRALVDNVGITTIPNGDKSVQYNPSIRGPLRCTFQIPGMVTDSDFARFRDPVVWLEYKVRTTLLAIRGSLNRPFTNNGTPSVIVQYVSTLFQPPFTGSTAYGLDQFYARDGAFWSNKPYGQNANHPYPPKWWGNCSIFLEPGRLR